MSLPKIWEMAEVELMGAMDKPEVVMVDTMIPDIFLPICRQLPLDQGPETERLSVLTEILNIRLCQWNSLELILCYFNKFCNNNSILQNNSSNI